MAEQRRSDAVERKLRAAGVPEYAMRLSLPNINAKALRDVVASKEFISQTGDYRSYLFTGRNAALGVDVFAKELVLSGVSVAYVSLVKILARYHHTDHDDAIPLANMYVIVDLAECGALPTLDRLVALEWVRNAVTFGSGVVTCSTDNAALYGPLPQYFREMLPAYFSEQDTSKYYV